MSLINLKEYHRPEKITEAYGLISENDGFFPMGGGTWLVPYGGKDVKGVVDLSEAGFDEVRLEEDRLHIGASVTLQNLFVSSETSTSPFLTLRAAIRAECPSPLIRSSSTVGGRVALSRPDSALTAVLIAADACVVLYGHVDKDMSLWEWVSDPSKRPDKALITSVEVKTGQNVDALAFEAVQTIPSAPPIISAAVGLERTGRKVHEARIVFSSVGSVVERAGEAESILIGAEVDDSVIIEVSELVERTLDVEGDARGSADYKRRMAAVLTVRCLKAALKGGERLR